MTFEELAKKVCEWRIEHKIDNPYRQMNKCLEELGEWSSEICRDHFDTAEAKDACGDTLVTCIVLADICGIDPVECLESAYNEVKNRKGKTEKGMFIKEQ